MHGKNRLASNSLLESLVFAKRTAHSVQEGLEDIPWGAMPKDLSEYQQGEKLAKKGDYEVAKRYVTIKAKRPSTG